MKVAGAKGQAMTINPDTSPSRRYRVSYCELREGVLTRWFASESPLAQECSHPNEYVAHEGMAKLIGYWFCPDCRETREWNAY